MLQAFRICPRSHHVIVTPLDSGSWPFPILLLGPRGGIVCCVAHECKNDTGELVGSRHGDKLEGLGLQQAICPVSQRIAGTLAMEQNGMSADYKQLAQISVTHLGDASQPASIRSILKNGLDRAFLDETPDHQPLRHGNIRGQRYFH